MSLGKVIKRQRRSLYMTQEQLAKDICAQSMLSKIERDELIPSEEILEKLGEKLAISVNKLEAAITESKDNTEQHFIQDIKRLVKMNLDKQEYTTTSMLLGNLNLEHYSLNYEDSVFFDWAQAMLEYYQQKNSEKALQILERIDLNDLSSDLGIKILDSIGRIYDAKEDYEKAIEIIQQALSLCEQSEEVSVEVKAQLLFNYAYTLKAQKKERESLEYVIEGIDYLVLKSSLFMLGYFYHLKGELLQSLGNLREALNNYSIALSLFEIENKTREKTNTQLVINEIKGELSYN